MTPYLPSRRGALTAAALAVFAAAVVLLVLDWRTIVGWVAVVGLFRLRYGRRHSRGLIVRGLEAAGIAGGGFAGWRALRVEARRREELHAARLETEHARAEELRSRAEYRKRTRTEQGKAERSAYWQGAVDGGR